MKGKRDTSLTPANNYDWLADPIAITYDDVKGMNVGELDGFIVNNLEGWKDDLIGLEKEDKAEQVWAAIQGINKERAQARKNLGKSEVSSSPSHRRKGKYKSNYGKRNGSNDKMSGGSYHPSDDPTPTTSESGNNVNEKKKRKRRRRRKKRNKKNRNKSKKSESSSGDEDMSKKVKKKKKGGKSRGKKGKSRKGSKYIGDGKVKIGKSIYDMKKDGNKDKGDYKRKSGGKRKMVGRREKKLFDNKLKELGNVKLGKKGKGRRKASYSAYFYKFLILCFSLRFLFSFVLFSSFFCFVRFLFFCFVF